MRCNVNNNKTTSAHGTDGQTDRQSATQYAAPPREEGRIIISATFLGRHRVCGYRGACKSRVIM